MTKGHLRVIVLHVRCENKRGCNMKRVHFVAIGGQGMSGIATILLSQGVEVSGSDIKPSEVTRRLSRMRLGVHRTTGPTS